MTEDKKSEEEWVMSGPTEKKVSDFLVGDSLEDEIFDDNDQKDPSLENELGNWGMELPPFLMQNNDAQEIELPEVIDDNIGALETSADTNFEESFEESSDISDSVNDSQETKTNILDHLGKNFFSDETEATSEHSLDDLVKDVDLNDGEHEIKGDLLELSTALSGEASSPTSDDEIFPESEDLEYPDLSQFNAPASNEDEVLLPDSDDLAYPGEESTETTNSKGPVSKLIPEDELIENQDEELPSDITDPSFNITQEMKSDLAKELESDEVDPEDFWATDDFPKIKKTLDKPITEVQASKQIKEDFFKEMDEEDNFKIIPSKRFSSITLDEVAPPSDFRKSSNELDAESEERIVEKVKEALTPAIEKIVKDLFSEKIEKVAWEVIPDLAENIIKHEVEEIAKQVYLSKDSADKE